MGLQGQNGTTVARNEGRFGRLNRLGTTQRHQNTLATLQATKRTVIAPMGIHPKAVDQVEGSRTRDLDPHPDPRGFAAFHDVRHPIPIRPRLFIGMVGLHTGRDLQR